MLNAHAQIRHFGNDARLANSANYFARNSVQAGCTRQKEPESGYHMHFQMQIADLDVCTSLALLFGKSGMFELTRS